MSQRHQTTSFVTVLMWETLLAAEMTNKYNTIQTVLLTYELNRATSFHYLYKLLGTLSTALQSCVFVQSKFIHTE